MKADIMKVLLTSSIVWCYHFIPGMVLVIIAVLLLLLLPQLLLLLLIATAATVAIAIATGATAHVFSGDR